MDTIADSFLSLIPPSLKAQFDSINFICEHSGTCLYEGVLKLNSQTYTIKALNTTSDSYKQNPHATSSIFVQELLRLCMARNSPVHIDKFAIYEKNIAYVTELSSTIKQQSEISGPLEDIQLDLLVRGVTADLRFLLHTLKPSQPIRVEAQDIYVFEKGICHLGNWAEIISLEPSKDRRKPKAGEIEGKAEMKRLASLLLELNQVKPETIKLLSSIEDPKEYFGAFEESLSGYELSDSIRMKAMVLCDPTTDIHQFTARLEGKSVKSMETMAAPVKSMGMKDTKQVSYSKTGCAMPSAVGGFKQPTILAVRRFQGFSLGWKYSNESVNAITFTASKAIRLLAVAFYAPDAGEPVYGMIKIVMGSDANGKKIYHDKVGAQPYQMGNTSKIEIIGAPIIQAGLPMTIIFELQGGTSYAGKSGMETVYEKEGVEFKFSVPTGLSVRNDTSVTEGQIPILFCQIEEPAPVDIQPMPSQSMPSKSMPVDKFGASAGLKKTK
mmetsp:Transcript_66026/g.76692  ORF Transcript_66026/g.76692 Transcript_66026/m.76692 type:complete len:496 (+) Transcript_66026:2-1489(+)